ncbi:MAG: cold shock domain-containing protein [Candidatus Omnitrophica bacterium]|nr:cold shock domain-containing protein [Candidatus Omnitrophota bacterium]MCB9719489.1 cold shock domain-containing protein [Candidatus Omnitrophota bacterium]
MPRGKVQEYHTERGHGTILDFGSNQPITVYANYVQLKPGQNLKEGMEVEYEILNNRSSYLAINVTIFEE